VTGAGTGAEAPRDHPIRTTDRTSGGAGPPAGWPASSAAAPMVVRGAVYGISVTGRSGPRSWTRTSPTRPTTSMAPATSAALPHRVATRAPSSDRGRTPNAVARTRRCPGASDPSNSAMSAFRRLDRLWARRSLWPSIRLLPVPPTPWAIPSPPIPTLRAPRNVRALRPDAFCGTIECSSTVWTGPAARRSTRSPRSGKFRESRGQVSQIPRQAPQAPVGRCMTRRRRAG
jgi:hypothetical protein